MSGGRPRRRPVPGAAALALALLLAAPLAAQQPRVPRPQGAPDENAYVGAAVPDVLVHLAGAAPRRLSEIWAERPVLLALVFTRCAGVCSPFLGSLKAAQETAGGAGKDYHSVVLSFDPRDTPRDLESMREHLGLGGRKDWILGTAEPAEIERLSRAVGFWFQWDESRKQFDHPGMLIAIERGRVARFWVGSSVPPVRLHEIVRELRGDFVSSYPLPIEVLFRCFEYDPERGFVIGWGLLVMLVPATLAFAGTLALFRAARRRR